MRTGSFLFGAVAGAAAAWFLDPNDGARRRNVARDKAFKYARKGGAEVTRKADYAAGAAKGAVYQAAPTTERGDTAERLNDPALARKVETEIFRDADVPKGDVSVNVENGVVYLRGVVGEPELVDRLGEEAGKVDGVRGVQNLLHTPGTPAPTKDETTTSA
jgi:osmotically-inducible protein OsmY